MLLRQIILFIACCGQLGPAAAQEIRPTYHFAWGVIGAGPAGIAAVGTLMQHGVRHQDIIWLDADFSGGSLRHYQEIQSNTPVGQLSEFFASCPVIGRLRGVNYTPFKALDKREGCRLRVVVQILQQVTDALRQSASPISSILGTVDELSWVGNGWYHNASGCQIVMHKVILATGAQPKQLEHPGLTRISLIDALTPSSLAKLVDSTSSVAVFGSSHSAMNVLQHLVDLKVGRIVNVCNDLAVRFREQTSKGIVHPYSGLKGQTAEWARKNIGRRAKNKIKRVLATDPRLPALLEKCQFVVDAIGFEPSKTIRLIDAPPARSPDEQAPNLFALGFAAPPLIRDANGDEEPAIGMLQFLQQAQEAIPRWLKN